MPVCVSVCLGILVSVCLCVCLSVYTITQKNNGSIHLKLEHIVVYENSSEEFDIGHCVSKVKVTELLQNFLHLPQYKLSDPISQLWQLGSCDYVCLLIR